MYAKGWVKIFNIDGGEILVTKEFDEAKDNSLSIIKVEARRGSIVDVMHLDCKTTIQCKEYFSKLSDQNIKELLHCMSQKMGN